MHLWYYHCDAVIQVKQNETKSCLSEGKIRKYKVKSNPRPLRGTEQYLQDHHNNVNATYQFK